jgi:LysM repeat protein
MNRLHNAWIILAAVCLTIAPAHAHAAHTRRPQAVNTSGTALHSKTASIAQVSAAGCSNPYTVRKGDTLAKIARRCGVSVSSLRNLNGLSGNVIRVGQALVIRAPRAKVPPPSMPVATPAPTPTIESAISPW